MIADALVVPIIAGKAWLDVVPPRVYEGSLDAVVSEALAAEHIARCGAVAWRGQAYLVTTPTIDVEPLPPYSSP